MPISYRELLKREDPDKGIYVSDFYKENKYGKIWNVSDGTFGPRYFTFDKETIYNFWSDFPQELTHEEVRTFVAENPTMARLRLSDEEIAKLMSEMTDEEKQSYAKFKDEKARLLAEDEEDEKIDDDVL